MTMKLTIEITKRVGIIMTIRQAIYFSMRPASRTVLIKVCVSISQRRRVAPKP